MKKVEESTLEMDNRPFVKTVQEIYYISNIKINQKSTGGFQYKVITPWF